MNMTTRYSVTERVPQRVYTTDARRRNFDTLLSAVVTPRNPDMLGLAWQGDLRPVGEAMAKLKYELGRVKDKARLGDAISKAVCDLAEYGNELGAGLSSGSMEVDPSGTLTTGTLRPEREFDLSGSASPGDLNRANDAMWNGSRTRDRGPALSTHATPTTIMQASRKMWANLLGRPQGQDRAAVARDSVRCTNQTSPADINRMNAEFHANAEPFRLGREWGKG
jgi:hypothetical protein